MEEDEEEKDDDNAIQCYYVRTYALLWDYWFRQKYTECSNNFRQFINIITMYKNIFKINIFLILS